MTTRVVLVGGGLANCLIALRLNAARPELDVQLIEAGPTLGGNHTWSFHGTDVARDTLLWLQPLASYTWNHHDVHFPGRRRRLSGNYHSLTAERLHQVTMAALGSRVSLGTPVVGLTERTVSLADGRTLAGDLVIDGRGLAGATAIAGLNLRFQKFLGQVLTLESGHGLTGPLLMDATVSQAEGYRFVYLLPFGPDRLLIEDTYYSDTPGLEMGSLRRNIGAYAQAQGLRIRDVEREETGVLPIVLDGDPETFWPAAEAGLPRSGLRAGLFHHTTGYSLPEAAALADTLVAERELQSHAVAPLIRARFRQRWREQRLFRLLNRMLFLAAPPAERYRVLQHFYRLPEPLIARFYAGRLQAWDAVRILSGTPPVPIPRALRAFRPASSRDAAHTHLPTTRGTP